MDSGIKVKQVADRREYEVLSPLCLGRKCFAPGETQRGLECTTRAYYGCRPDPYGIYHEDLNEARIRGGWMVVKG